MAISAGAAGAWNASSATTHNCTLPAHSAGQLIILIAACKATTPASLDIQVTTPATGWNKVASFADGTTASGNGTGSVTQAIFWREATSNGETSPVVTWGGSQTGTPGIAVTMTFNKAGGDVWDVPAVVQAATTNATSISVTMGSNPGITAGDWGVVTHTTADDAALTVPSWTATSATLAAVVEYPATALASGTSNDMAGDAAYRSVTSGTASAAPVVTGTQATAETGVTGFIRLRSSTAAPQTATPTTLALVTATFAPTVTAPNNALVTPDTLALTLASFAPTVATPVLVTPTTLALTTATFAPTVATPVLATPTTLALVLATFAPTVTATAHQTVTPTTLALVTATFEPTVSTPVLATPTTLALVLSTLAPTVTASNHQTVTPTTVALVLTTFEPTVTATAGDDVTATPTTVALVLTTFAPDVTALAPVTATPTTVALVLTTYAPTARKGGPIEFIDGDLVVTAPARGHLGGTAPARGRLRVTTPPFRGEF